MEIVIEKRIKYLQRKKYSNNIVISNFLFLLVIFSYLFYEWKITNFTSPINLKLVY